MEHQTHRRLTKAHKGDDYGLPDFDGRRINDRALCANHRGLFETARMVIS